MKYIATVIFALSLSSTALASSEERCEQLWINQSGSLSSPAAVSDGTLLRKWKMNEELCSGTTVYWGRLAMVHVLSNDFLAARDALSKAPNPSKGQGYVLAAARAQLLVQERLANKAPITGADLSRFESLYADVVKQYPSWPSGYALLGGVLTMQKKYVEATKALLVATKGNAYELSGVYRNLTVSLAGLGKYESAMVAADKAFEHDKSVTGDADFAYAVAKTNFELGHLDDAGVTLQVIAAKRPEVKADPEFQALVIRFREERARLKK